MTWLLSTGVTLDNSRATIDNSRVTIIKDCWQLWSHIDVAMDWQRSLRTQCYLCWQSMTLSLNKEEQKEKATISNNQPLKKHNKYKNHPWCDSGGWWQLQQTGSNGKTNNQPPKDQKINNQPLEVHWEKTTQKQKGTKSTINQMTDNGKQNEKK